MDVTVIGAGIAGLFAANQMATQGYKVCLIEAHPNVGGRIKTIYSKGSGPKIPMFDAGAWRIPSAHHRMLSLMQSLGLELIEVPSESDRAIKAWIGYNPVNSLKSLSPPEWPSQKEAPTVSQWTAIASVQGIASAEQDAAHSGYDGITREMASGTRVYGVGKKTGEDNMKFWVPKNGLSSVCNRLKILFLQKQNSTLLLNSRVSDVKKLENGLFEATVENRKDSKSNDFRTLRIYSKTIICACPPNQALSWASTLLHLGPILQSVTAIPLMKVFAPISRLMEHVPELENRPFHFKTNTLSEQCISSVYPGNTHVQPYIEIAYCAGNRANSLEQLRLLGKNELAKQVGKDVSSIFPSVQSKHAIENEIMKSDLQSFYWSHAVHAWRPTFTGASTLRQTQEACLCPHIALNGLFLCGEAISQYQGWSEGALQTSQLAVEGALAFLSGLFSNDALGIPRAYGLYNYKDLPAEYVIYDGRVLDVSLWKNVHPGSTNAITHHLNEDITQLFEANLHPNYALSIIFAIQKGWYNQH